MELEKEINQREFPSPRLKALINILFTSSWFNSLQNQVFKTYGISWQQYNILRILKGRKGQPASLKMLTSRMIDRNSNTSRLVDKLEKKGYVARTPNEIDRRKVDIYLTDLGLKVARQAAKDTEALMDQSINYLTTEEEAQLNNLLDKLRGPHCSRDL